MVTYITHRRKYCLTTLMVPIIVHNWLIYNWFKTQSSEYDHNSADRNNVTVKLSLFLIFKLLTNKITILYSPFRLLNGNPN